jgi:peptide/nickel transport system substrate-binding protein
MRPAPGGGLVLDLAESYSMSDDGLVYTFVIRPDVSFHDGEPVLADDVVFTVTTAQDSRIKSNKRANWEDVVVEATAPREVRFTLPKPYGPFLENLTMGILPKHLWQDISTEEFPFSSFNMRPVGSGPYRVKAVKQNASGIPTGYTLAAFSDYVGGPPYLQTVMLRFYPNEEQLIEAFRQREIESVNGISPERLSDLNLSETASIVKRTPLPRVFAVFFNQNQMPIFTHAEVRAALAAAIDKEALIATTLSGFGTPIDDPLPTWRDRNDVNAQATTSESYQGRLDAAAKILQKAGWKRNETSGIFEKKVGGEVQKLTFSLATADSPELKSAAMFVKSQWDALGAAVDIKIFEVGDLTQNVIRPRKYDAVLFGEVVGRDMDLFAFWHSSQRTDPGLNIALYANIKADELLAEARTTADPKTRHEKLVEFSEEIRRDIPAVFLYTPDFLYVIPERIKNVTFGNTTVPEERFLSIKSWYTDTELVWPIFIEQTGRRD